MSCILFIAIVLGFAVIAFEYGRLVGRREALSHSYR